MQKQEEHSHFKQVSDLIVNDFFHRPNVHNWNI